MPSLNDLAQRLEHLERAAAADFETVSVRAMRGPLQALRDRLVAVDADSIARHVEQVVLFDTLLLILVGSRRRDSYCEQIGVSLAPETGCLRLDVRRFTDDREVARTVVDLRSIDTAVAAIEQAIGAYLQETEATFY